MFVDETLADAAFGRLGVEKLHPVAGWFVSVSQRFDEPRTGMFRLQDERGNAVYQSGS